jgi:hypothetical protein
MMVGFDKGFSFMAKKLSCGVHTTAQGGLSR